MNYIINKRRFFKIVISLYLVVLIIAVVVGVKLVNGEVKSSKEENSALVVQDIEYKEVEKVVEVEKYSTDAPFELEEIGEFKVSGFTREDRTGKEIMRDYDGVSIATDPEVIPYGTKIWIEGVGIRQAQPNNQDINGNEIKVYFNTEEEKSGYGENTLSIYRIKE